MQPAPVFGKRSASRAPAPARTVAVATSDHAAFFAAARAETETDTRELAVPRSFRAALLAGLVVGCCLTGLDASHAGDALRALTGGLLAPSDARRLVPVMMALGLFGGAQAAATSLLVAHAVLRRVGLTTHLVYALAGGAVALAVSALGAVLARTGLVDGGLVTSHGLIIDAAAGAGAGFFYRVFAGAMPVTSRGAARQPSSALRE